MRAALVGAVDFNAKDFAARHAARAFDCIIAVDAGWLSCTDAGISADYALGDFDSLGYVPTGCEIVQFPHVKDESDMELACNYAIQLGADELFIYGAFAARLDHTFANIALLAKFAQEGCKMVGVGSDFAICALVGNTSVSLLQLSAFDPANLQGSYAPYLSLFTVGADVAGLSFEGMAYSAHDISLPAATSRGLSNEFIGEPVCISVREGVVIAIFPLAALEYIQ